MSEALVSVVIPLFNKAATLDRCVKSALLQSWKQIEVIIVDDGSTDGSTDMLCTVSQDSRVRVFRKSNGGACSARNFGVSRASGSYIAFLDADDMFLRDHIEVAMRRIAGRTNVAYYAPVI